MELAHKSLRYFIKCHWDQVETKEFVDGWHIGAVCEHLEAVSSGEIKDLIINIPPRHMKSLAVDVFWPAWDWLDHPELRWLFSSYADSLSIRDSVKCRRLIQSGSYEEMLMEYQPDMVLVGDQNTKGRFENNFGGYRLATSVGGALTGEGGDRLCIDDPHNIVEAESEVKREFVTDSWWDGSMSTRKNDPKESAKVVIMQRSHQNDLTGHILAKEKGWVHLCLPARHEVDRSCVTVIGFEDPRKVENEPLWPERFDDEELTELENILGSYKAAGQLQQRPSPRGGGMFKVELIDTIQAINKQAIIASIRYWDKAGTEGAGKRTAGVLIHKMQNGMYVIADVIKGQWAAGRREARIKQVAEQDGTDVRVWTEQEPGSGGKESAESTITNLAGFSVYADRVTGDKVTRADPLAAQVEIGNVKMLFGDWNKEFTDELELFPNGKFSDQVDGASGGFNKLTKKKKRAGVWGNSDGSRKKQVRRI